MTYCDNGIYGLRHVCDDAISDYQEHEIVRTVRVGLCESKETEHVPVSISNNV